jgi:hypothetical protein
MDRSLSIVKCKELPSVTSRAYGTALPSKRVYRHLGRVCHPGRRARLRSPAAGGAVCVPCPRCSLAPSGQNRPPRMAPGIRRGRSFPGSPASCGAHGRTRLVPACGPSGWRVWLEASARLSNSWQTQSSTGPCSFGTRLQTWCLTPSGPDHSRPGLIGPAKLCRAGVTKHATNFWGLLRYTISPNSSTVFYGTQYHPTVVR